MPAIHHRPFMWDADIEPITQFLLQSFTHYGYLFNWDPRRWQGMIYHRNDADLAQQRHELPKTVHLWLNADDQIVGVVTPEDLGSVYLQIHPDYRAIEGDMLDWVEASLPKRQEPDGQACMDVFAEAGDTHREALLAQRGYVKTEMYETTYRRPMSDPVPPLAPQNGYHVRSMRHDAHDRQSIASLLNAAFGRTIHSAEEYRNFQTSPYYRAAFDLVVEAADGTLVANAGFTVHEAESFALVEPVCTHPSHQGHGLARLAITEGLRRVQDRGIQTTFIGAWHSNIVANHVYQIMGFTDGVRHVLWRRSVN